MSELKPGDIDHTKNYRDPMAVALLRHYNANVVVCEHTRLYSFGAAADAALEAIRPRLDRDHVELRDRRTDDLNVRGHLSPQPGTGPDPMIPFELGPTIAPAVEWLVAELDRLRAAVPSWADLRDLLVAQRDATDVELTNAVMALISGQQGL